ncbi:hypothetical protein V8F06_010065 [Rhypophila decipiens]
MTQSEPVKGTLEDFSNEFKSGQFSDCKVKCGDSVWNLHKFVLFPHIMDLKEVESADPAAFPAYVEAIETYTQLYILADYLGLVDGCQEFYNRLETLLARGAAEFLTAKSFEIFLTEDAITRLVSCASLLPPADDIINIDASDSVSTGSAHGELMDFLHELIDFFGLQGKAHQLRPLLQVGASSHPDLLVDLLLYRTRGTQVSQNDLNGKPAPSEGYCQNDDGRSAPGTVSHPPWRLPAYHPFPGGGTSLYSGLGSGGGVILPSAYGRIM